MAPIVWIDGKHRLSRFRIFDRPFQFGPLRVPALESGFWFAFVNQQFPGEDIADELLLDKDNRKDPANIRRWLASRHDYKPKADWILRIKDVWMDILLHQYETRSQFYDVFLQEMEQIPNPLEVRFVAVAANPHPDNYVFTAGCRQRRADTLLRKHRRFSGFNLWGQLLTDFTQIVYGNGNRQPRFGIDALFGSPIALQPSRPFTMLLASDSQLQLISDVDKGRILYRSGGTFGSIADLLHEKVDLEQFHMVVIFAGINDAQRPDFKQGRLLDRMFWYLTLKNGNYIERADVLIVPTFPHPSVPESVDYWVRVRNKFANTSIKVVDWSSYNPFANADGSLNSSLFDPKGFHLNLCGVRVLYQVICSYLPGAGQVGIAFTGDEKIFSSGSGANIPQIRSVVAAPGTLEVTVRKRPHNQMN